jgi:16S rRNA (uracil1498-N3)-methyltransferase
MTRRRWIADQVNGRQAVLTGANAEHLARVLRARAGQVFEIATPDGVFAGTITDVEAARVTFALGEPVASVSEKPAVTLYLAIFKFDRMEWAIEKAVELGVSEIVPFAARRSDSHLVSSAAKRVERWRRIVREAAQQSRGEECEVSDPVSLAALLSQTTGSRIVLAETVREPSLLDSLAMMAPPIALAIGPEGGWTPEELTSFRKASWQEASLGVNILRAETAAIAALSIAMAWLSQSKP